METRRSAGQNFNGNRAAYEPNVLQPIPIDTIQFFSLYVITNIILYMPFISVPWVTSIIRAYDMCIVNIA